LKLLQNSAERKACCTLWGDRAALNSEAEKAEEAVDCDLMTGWTSLKRKIALPQGSYEGCWQN